MSRARIDVTEFAKLMRQELNDFERLTEKRWAFNRNREAYYTVEEWRESLVQYLKRPSRPGADPRCACEYADGRVVCPIH